MLAYVSMLECAKHLINIDEPQIRLLQAPACKLMYVIEVAMLRLTRTGSLHVGMPAGARSGGKAAQLDHR